jgi:hypothetical protein
MSDLLDKVQIGTVVRCATQQQRLADSVRKNDSLNEIRVLFNGALNDHHAVLEYNTSGRHEEDYFKEWGRWGDGVSGELQKKFNDAVDDGLIPIRKFTVSLVSDYTYNTVGSTKLDGIFGENITIENFDLNILRQDSFLKIGNDAVLQVTAMKSLCRRGLSEIAKQQDLTVGNAMIKIFQQREVGDPHCGVVCQVVRTGTIKAGDKVTNVISPNAGQPWYPVEKSQSIDQKIKFVTPDYLRLMRSYKLYTDDKS